MEATPERQLQIAEFTLDLDAAELRRGTDVIAVEPQVFDLIALLASHPGRVVSRDEIIEGVWHGRIVSDSAIATRINAARKALGDDGVSQAFIKTVHGRGFRFMVDPRPAGPPAIDADEASGQEPLEVRYCTAEDGVRLAYGALGSGPPLVKAAHYLTHLQFDTESRFHRHWVRELSKDHRLVRYDERGNGLSDWQIADFSFELMVKDLETVVDAMALSRFALLGVSQGAAVSVEYARRHPERVACLIVYGGYVAGWRNSGDAAFNRCREAMLELTRAFWGEANPAGRHAYAALFLPDGTPEQHADFIKLQQITTTAENAARILNTFAEIDVRAVLPQIRTPTLVMHCRDDGVVPFEAGRQIAAALPDARFVSLDGANHIIQKDDPAWPRFLAETRRFLAQHL